jgi:starch phosphorylase
MCTGRRPVSEGRDIALVQQALGWFHAWERLSTSSHRDGNVTTTGTIAYFSMEIALAAEMPTYSGGLGVLAGDTLRSGADLALPMIGVSLLHRKGYFFQRLDTDGRQREEPVLWSPDDWATRVDVRASVTIEDRPLTVTAWRYEVVGATGARVPVFLLDTDVEGNDPWDRQLTDRLYGGDARYRLAQEAVLGIGGVRILRALGHTDVARFHMNEGHSALLALELFAEEVPRARRTEEAVERVRARCMFTTHTPVPAGHDKFDAGLAAQVLGKNAVETLRALDCCSDHLNMTYVALQLSRYVNGVTRRHGEVSRSMFPGYPIGSITNGVHSATWTAPAFARLYDRHIPDWRRNSFSLRYASNIPLPAVAAAHAEAKRALLEEVNVRSNAGFDNHVLTLGFARRATAYKRPALLLHDPPRLAEIARTAGPLQIVFAGKAHPHDDPGKALIEQIVQAGRALAPDVRIAYLANYDLRLGLLMTSGVDVWVNTPKAPFEASGTSGMKAAHNGVPSLSVLDGWWVEGALDDITGWGIGVRGDGPAAEQGSDEQDADQLYRLLAERVIPLYYTNPTAWLEMARWTISLNASFFNTHRMLQEYVAQGYRNNG